MRSRWASSGSVSVCCASVTAPVRLICRVVIAAAGPRLTHNLVCIATSAPYPPAILVTETLVSSRIGAGAACAACTDTTTAVIARATTRGRRILADCNGGSLGCELAAEDDAHTQAVAWSLA